MSRALAALVLLLAACAEPPPPAAPGVEILVHGRGERHALADGDARRPALLAELDSLLASARPAAAPLDRRGQGLVAARGALEFRFTAPHVCVDGRGDSLALWRALIPLGVEPAAPGGESGVLVLLGHPDYSPHPHLSARGRTPLLRILESPPSP